MPNSREKSEGQLVKLTNLLDNDIVFDLSDDFLTCDNADDDSFLALSQVVFDADTRRYHAPNARALKPDDWILQAMVMLQLERLEHGWGEERMVRQLSVWDDCDAQKTKCRLTDLPNLWKEEIQELKRTPKTPKGTKQMKLSKGLEHFDSFAAFCNFYHGTLRRGRDYKRARRSTSESQFKHVHVLSEQAAVQWALDIDKQLVHLMELAARVIRLQRHNGQQSAEELCRLLREQAEVAAGDGSFVKRAMTATDGQTSVTSTAAVASNSEKRRRVVLSTTTGAETGTQ